MYSNLIQELREENAVDRHRQYLRMDKSSFDSLVNLIGPKIAKSDTNMRESIKPAVKIAVTLHHLAEGSSHHSIAAHY